MEETVGPVSTCGRELLRGWRRPIGLMVSFTIFIASVRKMLDTTIHIYIYAYIHTYNSRCQYVTTLQSVSKLHYFTGLDIPWPYSQKLDSTLKFQPNSRSQTTYQVTNYLPSFNLVSPTLLPSQYRTPSHIPMPSILLPLCWPNLQCKTCKCVLKVRLRPRVEASRILYLSNHCLARDSNPSSPDTKHSC